MKLVENWKEAWRWFSVQALAALLVLPLVWTSLPADLKSSIPDSWDKWIVILVAGAGLVGRLIDQNSGAK